MTNAQETKSCKTFSPPLLHPASSSTEAPNTIHIFLFTSTIEQMCKISQNKRHYHRIYMNLYFVLGFGGMMEWRASGEFTAAWQNENVC